jgi:hypothetical protein
VHGLALRRIKVEQTHNALLLQDIDSCDAVILDCRHASVPAWIAACLLTRPVPTIKLVHLAEGEAITKVALHPLIAGTKMDARDNRHFAPRRKAGRPRQPGHSLIWLPLACSAPRRWRVSYQQILANPIFLLPPRRLT